MGNKFILGQEDGTVAGGNLRGDGAVDLQIYRSANTQVASGSGSFAAGGNNNPYGQYAVAIGTTNSVGGGEASVALGIGNTITGYRSFAAGNAITISGTSSVGLGRTHNIAGTYAFAAGFTINLSADYAIGFGSDVSNGMYGGIANANGRFQYQGDAQVMRLLARREASLTTGATTKLSLDGTGTTNLIDFNFSSSSAMSIPVTITWSAGINNANGATGITKGDCITQTDKIMLKRVSGGLLTLVGGVTTSATKGDVSMTGCTMNYSVSSYGELILNFQGPTFASGGPVTARVLANIEAVLLQVAPF